MGYSTMSDEELGWVATYWRNYGAGSAVTRQHLDMIEAEKQRRLQSKPCGTITPDAYGQAMKAAVDYDLARKTRPNSRPHPGVEGMEPINFIRASELMLSGKSMRRKAWADGVWCCFDHFTGTYLMCNGDWADFHPDSIAADDWHVWDGCQIVNRKEPRPVAKRAKRKAWLVMLGDVASWRVFFNAFERVAVLAPMAVAIWVAAATDLWPVSPIEHWKEGTRWFLWFLAGLVGVVAMALVCCGVEEAAVSFKRWRASAIKRAKEEV